MPIDPSEYEYAGFWIRVWAALIDTFLVLLITTPILEALYGSGYAYDARSLEPFQPIGFLVSWVLPALAVILFWRYRAATPGKMVIGARVVDARTGEPPKTAQLVVRYLGYFVSTFPFCLGLIWVGFDRRKQGWHDKIARTVVIRSKHRGREPVRFEAAAEGTAPGAAPSGATPSEHVAPAGSPPGGPSSAVLVASPGAAPGAPPAPAGPPPG